MSSKSQSRVARPMNRSEIERQELAGAIRRALPRDGRVEMQPGLTLFRVSTPTEPVYGVSESSFCVIAQGAKHVMLGEDRFRYDPNHYLISTVGLPTISQIDLASSEEPYLGLRLILDPAVVTSTMVEAGLVHRQNDSGVKAIAVSALDPDLLNACLRLVLLLQMPEQYRVLGPLVIREIVYRLLIGEQGHRMCHLATIGGHAHRIVRAVKKLREDFAKPLRHRRRRARDWHERLGIPCPLQGGHGYEPPSVSETIASTGGPTADVDRELGRGRGGLSGWL
jgi:AraC-type transcriptional regulator N-terminus